MAEEKASKININGQEYEVKDAQARENIAALQTLLQQAQTTIEELKALTPFDTTPTENSAKGVTSGGVKTALDEIPKIKKVTYQYDFDTNETCSCAEYGISAQKRNTPDPRQVSYWNISYPPEVQNKVIAFRITHWGSTNRVPTLISNHHNSDFNFCIDKGTSIGTGSLSVTFYYQ